VRETECVRESDRGKRENDRERERARERDSQRERLTERESNICLSETNKQVKETTKKRINLNKVIMPWIRIV
jgi:hypothetical protein